MSVDVGVGDDESGDDESGGDEDGCGEEFKGLHGGVSTASGAGVTHATYGSYFRFYTSLAAMSGSRQEGAHEIIDSYF